jgi:peroxidase
MGSRALKVLLIPLSSFILLFTSVSAQLSVDYYSKTCPNAEEIVRKEMIQILSVAPSLAGPFLRLHFHDCFVRVRYNINGSDVVDFYLYDLNHYIILKRN